MDAFWTAILTSLIPAVTVVALVAFAGRVFDGVSRRKREQECARDRERWQSTAAHQKEEQRAREKARFRQAAEQTEQNDASGKRRFSSPGGSVKDENYYGRILGLSGQVNVDAVKSQYRTLVAQYHPDKVHHLGPKLKEVAEKEMKEINEAFEYFRRKYGHTELKGVM